MTTCCTRLSKWYMLTTNILFFCLGTAFLALGVLGLNGDLKGTSLFPKNTFRNLLALGVVICFVSIIGVIGVFIRKRWIIYSYILIIVVSLVLQAMIGVKVYQKAANKAAYLTDLWTFSSTNFRNNLQDQFNCCGFQTIDHNCPVTSNQSCATVLQSFVSKNFSKMYYVLFAALSFQALALSNAITVICAATSSDDDDNIRLSYATSDTSSDKESLMYNHSNFSNKFSDTYLGQTVHNNRHGN